MRFPGNQKGYTLTELMVVVAIVGVLAALAIPTYISYLPHLRLNSAVSDVVSYIRSARAQAAVKGRVVQLNFILSQYPIADTVQILDSVTGTPLIGAPESIVMNVDIDSLIFGVGVPVQIQSGDSSTGYGGNHQIYFTPLGSVVDANGAPNGFSIKLCSIGSSGTGCANSIEQYRIDVSPTTGLVKSCSGWNNPCP